LSFEPGSKFEYHPTASMWVIAELIERASNMTFTDFVQTLVVDPLGLKNLFVGLPEGENARALACEHVGENLTSEQYKELGIPVPPVTEVTEEAILGFNDPEFRAVGVPGGGGFANATDMALFYQALLTGNGLWKQTTLEDVRRVRTGDLRDLMFRKKANRGLGIIIAGDEDRSYRGFGKTNSPLAFGHNGAGGQLAWVDPVSGISLCYLTNGHDRNEMRQGRRGVAIGSIAADTLA
jgi:CubicO group peptidase (beta-lactamase class C family)